MGISEELGLAALTQGRTALVPQINAELRRNARRLQLFAMTMSTDGMNPEQLARLTRMRDPARLVRLSKIPPEPNAEDNADFEKLSEELANNRTFLGRPIADIRVPGEPGQPERPITEVLPALSLLNTPDVLQAAVTRNTGGWGFDFLNDMFKGATPGQFFRGLFKWFGQLFSPPAGGHRMGFMECVASCTADDICNDVNQNLPAGLDAARRNQVLADIRHNIMSRVDGYQPPAGYVPPERRGAENLNGIQPEALGERERGLIAGRITGMIEGQRPLLENVMALTLRRPLRQTEGATPGDFDEFSTAVSTSLSQSFAEGKNEADTRTALRAALRTWGTAGGRTVSEADTNAMADNFVGSYMAFTRGEAPAAPNLAPLIRAQVEAKVDEALANPNFAAMRSFINRAPLVNALANAGNLMVQPPSAVGRMASQNEMVDALKGHLNTTMVGPNGIRAILNLPAGMTLTDAEMDALKPLAINALANMAIRPDSDEAKAAQLALQQQLIGPMVKSRLNAMMDRPENRALAGKINKDELGNRVTAALRTLNAADLSTVSSPEALGRLSGAEKTALLGRVQTAITTQLADHPERLLSPDMRAAYARMNPMEKLAMGTAVSNFLATNIVYPPAADGTPSAQATASRTRVNAAVVPLLDNYVMDTLNGREGRVLTGMIARERGWTQTPGQPAGVGTWNNLSDPQKQALGRTMRNMLVGLQNGTYNAPLTLAPAVRRDAIVDQLVRHIGGAGHNRANPNAPDYHASDADMGLDGVPAARRQAIYRQLAEAAYDRYEQERTGRPPEALNTVVERTVRRELSSMLNPPADASAIAIGNGRKIRNILTIAAQMNGSTFNQAEFINVMSPVLTGLLADPAGPVTNRATVEARMKTALMARRTQIGISEAQINQLVPHLATSYLTPSDRALDTAAIITPMVDTQLTAMLDNMPAGLRSVLTSQISITAIKAGVIVSLQRAIDNNDLAAMTPAAQRDAISRSLNEVLSRNGLPNGREIVIPPSANGYWGITDVAGDGIVNSQDLRNALAGYIANRLAPDAGSTPPALNVDDIPHRFRVSTVGEIGLTVLAPPVQIYRGARAVWSYLFD